MFNRKCALLRRLFRFRLRTLFLAVFVIGVAMGIYVDRVRRQQAAVAAFKKVGGWIMYDYQLNDDWYERDAASPVPDWLKNRLGEDYFHSVTFIAVGGQQPMGLRAVPVNDIEAADELLRHLDGLPWLEQLILKEVVVTDNGLAHVGKLRHLGVFYIEDASHVSDAGVAHLAGCRQLQNLGLSRLSNNRFTNCGLAHLGQMRQLSDLKLDDSLVSDDGLAHLANLTELSFLQLQNTQVTDVGLKHLQELRNLRWLDLSGTRVTDIAELQTFLPYCEIRTAMQ